MGPVGADCGDVDHYYEIDATIADLFVVSEPDRKKIIGKPTLHLIIDRKFRLIFGSYYGLENASWTVLMQATFTIAMDYCKLYERYGVKYYPEDWPAHMVFPTRRICQQKRRTPAYLANESRRRL